MLIADHVVTRSLLSDIAWTNLARCVVLAACHVLQASRSQRRDELFRMA